MSSITKFPAPFDYQSLTLTKVGQGWKDFRRQLVVAPTGSGKTAMFCWMADAEAKAGRRTLIIVDQDELVQQTLDKLMKFTGIIGHLEQGPAHASRHGSVVVTTIQTMSRRCETWPQDHFSLVIADEADRSLADTWQKTLKWFDGHALVCGFTATPFRADKRDLGEYYDNIPIQLKLVDLIRDGYLSKICVHMVPIRIDLGTVSLEKGDYSMDQLDHAITPYLESAVQHIKRLAATRKVLVFLPLIRTSERFVALCRAAGLAAEHIDGTSEDRREKLARFKRRDFNILANSQLLTRGYDDPDIDTLMPLRPTKVVSLYHQMVGRGTRIFPGKDFLMLIDCLFQSQKHMVCRPANLIAETSDQAEYMTKAAEAGGDSNLDLLDLAVQGTHAREEALRKQLDAVAKRKAQFISADQFAAMHDNLGIIDFEPEMRWQHKPPTAAQLKHLEAANINPESVRGIAHASLILDQIFKDKNSQPASRGQRYLMFREHWRSEDGTRNAWQATIGEARQFFINRTAAKKRPQKEFAWE